VLKNEHNYYEIIFKNRGGLVMPLILEFEYKDGKKELYHIPAEIWRKNHEEVSKVFVVEEEIAQISLDPYLETADIDTSNNYFPSKKQISRFDLFKQNKKTNKNLMQQLKGQKTKSGTK